MQLENYRPEIDGLRAIAVLAVLIFHINPNLLPSGFIGVDIFFVISGYVVSRSIFNQPNQTIIASVAQFYQRRIRRLFPALLIMLAAVAIAFAAFVPAFPVESHNFIYRYGVLSLFGVSNLYAIRAHGNYFDGDSIANPFMHTWSLGVEEQFYLFYPIALFVFSRYFGKKHFLKAFSILILFSGMASIFYSARLSNPIIGYYFMPSRFWELAIGCAIALRERRLVSEISNDTAVIKLAWLRHTAAMLGILGALIFTQNSGFPFPGALLAVLSTAVLIMSGENTRSAVYSWLRVGLLQYLGRASYSIYLWHWPIIVLTRKLVDFNIIGMLVAISLSMIIGLFSYHWVEQKFRLKNADAKITFGGAFAAVIVSAGFMVFISLNAEHFYLGKSQPWDTAWNARREAKIFAGEITEDACHAKSVIQGELNLSGPCFAKTIKTATQKSPVPTLFVFGDSHAFSSWKMTASGAKVGLYNFYVKSFSGCRLSFPNAGGVTPCQDYWQKVARLIGAQARATDFVYLSIYLNNYVFNSETNENFKKLISIVEKSGATLIIEAPLINHNEQAVDCIVEWFTLRHRRCETNKISNEIKNAPALNFITTLSEKYENIFIWHANDLLCPGQECSHFRDGLPLFRDDDHLSLHGSETLAPYFQKFLIELQKRRVDQDSVNASR